MNKKIILINTTMFLICFMTACSIFPDGTVNSAEETIAVTVDGSGQLKGNLNDAIEVDADNSKTVHTGDVYDVKIKPVKKNKEKSDINAEKFADYLNLSIKDFSYNGNGDNFIYTLSDGTKYSDGRNIQYYSQDDVIRNYRIYISDNVKNDFPLYELEDFSLEEAKSKAQEVFNLFPGISISSEPIHAYAIDAEHAQDYQKKHKYPNIRYYIENDKELLNAAWFAYNNKNLEQSMKDLNISRNSEDHKQLVQAATRVMIDSNNAAKDSEKARNNIDSIINKTVQDYENAT